MKLCKEEWYEHIFKTIWGGVSQVILILSDENGEMRQAMKMKNSKYPFILSILLLGSLLTSACGSLLNQVENAVQQEYGPQYTAQERQTRTFEVLWNDLQEHYIHYDSAKVDWTALHEQYTAKIQAGLTGDQFTELMGELEKDLPVGALVYQSRSERIDADIADLSSYEGIGAIIGFCLRLFLTLSFWM